MFGSVTRGRSGGSFEAGIANLAIEDLFVPYTEKGVEYKTQISVSFLEIYNEHVKDLLRNTLQSSQ